MITDKVDFSANQRCDCGLSQIPYVTGWKGKGMDTKVSLKQALKSLGKLKQKHNAVQRKLDDMRKDNQTLSEEKDILQGVSDRYDR